MIKPGERTRVYVAGPYSGGDQVINTRNAIEAGNVLWDNGFAPFIPHLSLLWHMATPRPYEDWLAIDNEWVVVCHVLLRLPGKSSGADDEAELMRSLGRPVYTEIVELMNREARPR